MRLIAQKREKLGKAARGLRQDGLIPAELYGHGMANIHLSVPAREFTKVLDAAGSSTVVDLQVGAATYPVLIYDIQKNFVSDDVAHVDFYRVQMDQKIRAKVPLEFVGESVAVKSLSGLVTKSMAEIEVEALPSDLPHSFVADLSRLDELGKSIYVKDLTVPPGVTLHVEPGAVIATVSEYTHREEEVAPAAPETVDVSAVKVEAEEKKIERATKKETEAEKR